MNFQQNETLFQAFHWYSAEDGSFWNSITQKAPELAKMGITMVWLPPAGKGLKGANEVGYGVYDLYDLGEFDQKGTIRTKYGTKEEYICCVETLHKNGIKVIADIVLNHRIGGDETEKVLVQAPNPDNRNELSKPFERETQSKYTFPGRNGKYSQFIWDHRCFTGIDNPDPKEGEPAFFKIVQDHMAGWDEVPTEELGNYDYLLGADVEFRNPTVKAELKNWVKWFYNTAPFEGVRLDAVKHMNPAFITEWLEHLEKAAGMEMFKVAEYWSRELEDLRQYKEKAGPGMKLFDAGIHYNFQEAAEQGKDYDLRNILANTLLKEHPDWSVSIVDNHDTQPLQLLESPVKEWFHPHAYSILLLRQEGIPCVFAPALYGAHYADKNKEGKEVDITINPVVHLDQLLRARAHHAYGPQRDYFDDPNLIGWTREGIAELPQSGCVVVLSNNREGSKSMEIGKRHAGKKMSNVFQFHSEEILINKDGYGKFPVKEGSVSVWIFNKN